MTEIKPGDVVVLKSGGLPMTVEEINTIEENKPFAVCSWFDKGEYKTQNIFLIALEPYVPPQPFF